MVREKRPGIVSSTLQDTSRQGGNFSIHSGYITSRDHSQRMNAIRKAESCREDRKDALKGPTYDWKRKREEKKTSKKRTYNHEADAGVEAGRM